MSHFNETQLTEILEKTLSQAKQRGATAAEVDVGAGAGFNVAVRMGEIETIEHNQHKGLEITVYFGQKMGTVSTSDLTEAALITAVEKACNIAKFTSEDPYAGLAEKELLAFDYPNLDLYYPWNITPEQGIAIATECETIARNEDKRIQNSEGAMLNTYVGFQAYGNTNGFIGSYKTSRHTLNCALVATDGHVMQRDYDYTSARDPQDLEEASVIGKRVAARTVQRLGARKITTRQCPVIFAPEIARGLVGHFISAISGGQLYRKASFLLNKLNEKVFPEFIHIEEHPHFPKGIGSAPFDREGVRTYDKDLVEQGVLKTYLLGSYSARKLGMRSTGNAGGAHNIFISPTTGKLAELLKQMDTGLLITELLGQGVNIVTGDYSRGAFGFWVEKGEIQYPVHEITIAGNLKNMFSNIIAVGNDVDHRGNIRSGSILISEMTIAGE